VLGFTRRDQVSIDDYFGVFPVGARVDQVGANVGDRGGPSTPYDVGLRQHPASVADSRHELAVAVETLHQVDHGRVPPHLVRGIATRDHHAIKIFSADVLGAHFGLARVAVAASVCLPGRLADNLDLCASSTQAHGGIP